jgi:PEGA domain
MKSFFSFLFLAAWALACPAFAGGQSSDKIPVSSHSSIPYQLRTVLIDSRPIGSDILINGTLVGKTPLIVEIAVDSQGYAVRPMVLRGVAPLPNRNATIARYYPVSLSSQAVRVPSEINFDLFIGVVQVLKIAER